MTVSQRKAHVSAAGAASHAALRDEALRGLGATPKALPPKLFYDAAGAALFERITALPEYYLTRAELEILRGRVGEVAALAGPRSALLEYGSGAGVKVRLLLDAFAAVGTPLAAYVPIDISREQLGAVAAEIAAEYPGVAVRPVCADYTGPLHVPDLPERVRRVAFFPGSTIGNFPPTEAAAFLRRVRATLGPDGALILGVDRRKEPRVLEAAYDDAVRRRGGRNGGVQPQPAGPPQPRARRRLRPRASGTAPCGTTRRAGSRCTSRARTRRWCAWRARRSPSRAGR